MACAPFAGAGAALFDLDGTLVETHIDFPLMRQRMLGLAAAAGCDASSLAGLDILAILERACDRVVSTDGPEASADLRRRGFAELEALEVEQCARPSCIPGAAELLWELGERGIAVGIVTRNCRRVAETLIADGGLRAAALVTRDDVPRTKPDPAHLHAAMRLLGVQGQAVMTGDHPLDVMAGRAAGMATVGLLFGRAQAYFDGVRPDYLVDGPAELLRGLLEGGQV